MKAMIRWNTKDKMWELFIKSNGEYVLSKAWYTPEDRVHDSIICEIARLTDLGYTIEYKLG